jgi:hypothetical protein
MFGFAVSSVRDCASFVSPVVKKEIIFFPRKPEVPFRGFRGRLRAMFWRACLALPWSVLPRLTGVFL